jgi:DNA-binding NarL/FixJ family response regulator
MTTPARVLVVDDDSLLQRNLIAWLTAAGYEAFGAGSVAEATQVAGWETFDLAIVDLQLPDGTGIDVLQRLRERQPGLVCLVLTGTATVDNAVATLRHGQAFDFLRKPITDMTTLQTALDAALAHRRTLPPPRVTGAEPPGGLSERELDILAHLGRGMANKDIAERAGISEKTVRNHLSAIYRKLGVDNRTKALVIYQQWRSNTD